MIVMAKENWGSSGYLAIYEARFVKGAFPTLRDLEWEFVEGRVRLSHAVNSLSDIGYASRTRYLPHLETINFWWDYLMGLNMAIKRVEPKTKGNWQKEFVNVSLTAADKESVKVWTGKTDLIVEYMLKAITDGYELKQAWNMKTNTYMAYMSTSAGEGVNAGLMLTGIGSTPLNALASLLYKHFTIFKGKQWPSTVKTADDFG